MTIPRYDIGARLQYTRASGEWAELVTKQNPTGDWVMWQDVEALLGSPVGERPADSKDAQIRALLKENTRLLEENRTVLAASRSPEARLAPEGWQDISTAPKDADSLLLYLNGSGVQPGYWDADRNAWLSVETQGLTGGTWHSTPTHWMPLPLPPAPQEPRS